jgi:sRNA-binding carbon storage regulator CsrA
LAQMQDGITITVYECEHGGVKLKISAPKCLSIYRPDAHCGPTHSGN